MSLTADLDAVLAKRHDNGGDFWASSDGKLAVGSPFSTIEALQIVHELGLDSEHETARGGIDLLLGAWREDGRYKLAPRGTLYPCQSANVARVLCRFGYAGDSRVQRTLEYLLEIQHEDGGWRCNKTPLGRRPETDASNPGITLFVLDAFRFTRVEGDAALDRAVDNLLDHWRIRRPLGPCAFGIGTLFGQVEYPFLRYNLFSYVYILSFYARARDDERFREALSQLRSKLDEEGRMVVERPNRKLTKLSAFAKGRPSEPATARYREIVGNCG